MTKEHAALEQCDSLLLLELFEPCDNALTLIVGATSAVQEEGSDLPPELSGARVMRIDHRDDDPVFSLTWDSYVAYTVMNESFALPNEDDRREGRLLVKFKASRYGDYVRSATWADDASGNRNAIHWQVNCENHSIDIVSNDEPRLELKRHK